MKLFDSELVERTIIIPGVHYSVNFQYRCLNPYQIPVVSGIICTEDRENEREKAFDLDAEQLGNQRTGQTSRGKVFD